MRKEFSACLTLLALSSTLSFSQVKYDSNGDFGIGTSSPSYLLHLKDADPVMLMESTGEHDNTIRLCEGPDRWLGAYIKYDGGLNRLFIGTHIAIDKSTSNDKNVLTIHRSDGKVELTPISTAYNFQSFVTNAPNYETQCYNVKLGYSNNFWVDGDGDVWHSGLHTISDASLKENITDLTSSLEIINQLRPVKYNFVKGAFGERVDTMLAIDGKARFGLIAQEVEEVLPEIVSSRGDSLKAISYLDLIPLLIDAMQTQQNEIRTLKDQVASLSDGVKKSAGLESMVNSIIGSSPASLFQNIPNPFNENTTIRYSIPEINSYAMVNVYDLQGHQVKSYQVTQTGNGEIMIPGSELNPGLFVYNLIVDGIEVSSRRMVLIE